MHEQIKKNAQVLVNKQLAFNRFPPSGIQKEETCLETIHVGDENICCMLHQHSS